MTILYGISEEIGWRESMEDEYTIHERPEKNFFSAEVYDGHGGGQAARIAAEMLTPRFLDAWIGEFEKMPKERRQESEILREAYIAVDNYMVDRQLDSGTTAASFYIIEDRFIAANTGDTRVIIGTKDGALTLTKDHKPDLPAEKSRIESLGGQVIFFGVPRVQGILAVSRALGDAFLKPYVSPEPRIVDGYLGKENDYVVLACDGIWDVLDAPTVISLARNAGDPQKAAERITATALESGGTDNMTVIVLDLRQHTDNLENETLRIASITDKADRI